MARTDDPAYRAARKALLAQGLPCWLCAEPIDYEAKFPDPLSFSADHVIPVSMGGSNHGELKPSHLACNRKRNNRPREVSGIQRVSPWA